jgi:hypothetical protein
MTLEMRSHYSLLDELDTRQDELLEQIDQLNCRLELLLTQFAAAPADPLPPPATLGAEDPL